MYISFIKIELKIYSPLNATIPSISVSPMITGIGIVEMAKVLG